ncbi:MAG: hypothetical protein M3Y35_08830 [Actinomycetota bacterium]|nr:hypothetical protein [Actinomycetota bacterium]
MVILLRLYRLLTTAAGDTLTQLGSEPRTGSHPPNPPGIVFARMATGGQTVRGVEAPSPLAQLTVTSEP